MASSRNLLFKGLCLITVFLLVSFFVCYQLLGIIRDGGTIETQEVKTSGQLSAKSRAVSPMDMHTVTAPFANSVPWWERSDAAKTSPGKTNPQHSRRNSTEDQNTTRNSKNHASMGPSPRAETTSPMVSISSPTTHHSDVWNSSPATVKSPSVTPTNATRQASSGVHAEQTTSGVIGSKLTPKNKTSLMTILSASREANLRTSSGATTSNPNSCLRRPYQIRRVCSLTSEQVKEHGPDITLEDILDAILSPVIRNDLKNECEGNVWCLTSMYSQEKLIESGNEFMDLCGLKACLTRVPDECRNVERGLAISTLLLLCSAKVRNPNQECNAAIRKALYLSSLPVLHGNTHKWREAKVCPVESQWNCSGRCGQVGHNLHCMCEACHGASEIFKQFSPWHWYFADMKQAMHTCNKSLTDCTYFKVKLQLTTQLYIAMKKMDVKVLSGIVASLLITLGALGIVLWACVKKIKPFSGYSRSKIGYTEVKSAEMDEAA